MNNETPLLSVTGAGHRYGDRFGCRDVNFDLWPGEVLAVVGESGSGKSTLLGMLSQRLTLDEGSISYLTTRESSVGREDGTEFELLDLATLSEREVRRLWRTEWGFVHQNAAEGLRMHVSAGGNVGEPLMANGWRNYSKIRSEAEMWLRRVEIPSDRIDDTPATFSGGMRQRVQIARNLVFGPRLVFMDEPTSGLDVSVQARLLDLIRQLVAELGLAVVIVTHDLAVARLISHRTLVMKDGAVIESGLTDRVLDDPQAPYTQLLVSSILQG
ncbi:phosphonate C-P lyase system protein PhnK [Arthrobacter glacialis]|uniref:phosphonate C-P lyase system protein PhnK n=1 Tax=Arthrobacter glacialis TaxID=1664 RepID=UPI000CD43B46|nr:phosphonate C-P lyase system protein PhnK [Arthrobacter glacialis]POH57133.1 phosphonate C-P lyase system protein PhnK [Arthrobacter glacialis]